MARDSSAWMEFRGTRSSDKLVRVIALPNRPRAAMRGKAEPALGRSGSYWNGDGAYDNFPLKPKLRMIPGANWSDISAWLTGAGDLRFSDDPNYVYRARAVAKYEYARFLPGCRADNFDVEFDCQPFRYAYNPQPIQAPNSSFISNPGNIDAEPIITVYGNGSVNLMIGLSTVLIDDLSGYITLDCEAKMARKGDTLENNKVRIMGGWPVLKVGQTAVSWTGGATSVEVVPNFRWL